MVDGRGNTWRSRAPVPRARTRKHREAGYGRPVDRGAWTAKTVKRPAQPQYGNCWVPLMRKRHILPHPAQPQHTNHWAPRTRKRHQPEHRPQWPTESSDPTQHAKGRRGDCPGPCTETTTRRNVTQGGAGWHMASVLGSLPLAAPIGLSPLLILTLCGSECVLVVSTEPLDGGGGALSPKIPNQRRRRGVRGVVKAGGWGEPLHPNPSRCASLQTLA